MQLRARPAVRKANIQIIIPRAARTVLRPNPEVFRKIQEYNSKPPKVLAKPMAMAVKSPRVSPRMATKAQQANRIPRRATIRYVSREMTPEHRKSLAYLKGTGKGKILIIVGNGPSILEAQLEKLRGQPLIDIMSINKPDGRLWPTKYWLFCDSTQWKHNKELWDTYNGTIFNTTAISQSKRNAIHIRNLGGDGFSTNLLDGFYIGRSSCYAAMQVALWLDYDHIYLFGVDMKSVTINGKRLTHYYGENPDVRSINREARFDNEAKHYQHAANTLTVPVRAKFTFCSTYNPYPFIDRFSRLDHHTAADHILSTLVDGKAEKQP